ncbi:divalent-cation tolerance protein CutA [Desulfobulbus rhabdoformis]|jgi:periplasmic divalent cation tolerance protein|uniref:divalent-cation tolerance protein CutA n=1 Tax=Desulfobulbus rhabdoformis TaxID=34032 RepID=UPI001964FD60|nr:divalent-cation tolerance protein CutA [Desulfobulbus rhabdoformis]MBM9614938.1 divalent-cation tolerance protein CutA [Desulfobulbus rhabdoformis]
MLPFIQVVTTLPDQKSAEVLASTLLEQRLVACVQLSPCASRFHWQGKIEEEHEVVCTMKSHHSLFAELEEAITTTHPYDVPEILATPIVAASAAYGDWLKRELKEV